MRSIRALATPLSVATLAASLVGFPARPTLAAAGQCRALFEAPAMKTLQQRLSETKILPIRLGDGKVLFAQYTEAADPNLPLILMLPGANRMLLPTEDGIPQVAGQGFGVVSISLPTQPLSVGLTPKDEVPSFRKENVTLASFARDIEKTISILRRDLGVKDIVPIALSYTGAVAPHLKGLPLVIDTAPMTSAKAADLKAGIAVETFRAAEFFNPVFGPRISRKLLDQGYRDHWSSYVDNQAIQAFGLPVERRDDMIDGYRAMMQATEGFTWRVGEIDPSARHVFMLGGQEAPHLLKSQLETYKQVLKKRKDTLLIVVKDGHHLLQREVPNTYAFVLKLLLTNAAGFDSGVIVVDAEAGKIEPKSGADAEAVVAELLKKATADAESIDQGLRKQMREELEKKTGA